MSDGGKPMEPLSDYVGRGMREVGAAWESLVDERDREIAELTAQRDDLLAALEGLVKGVDGFWESEAGLDRTLCTGAMADAVNRANTAIAKARGAK